MMSKQDADWFCVHFESMPTLDVLAEYRRIVGPDVPMFFFHSGADSGLQATLYLPPDATRVVQKINTNPKLQPLTPCHRPPADGIKMLFGDELQLADYFPLRSE